jgi:hypothetical protein
VGLKFNDKIAAAMVAGAKRYIDQRLDTKLHALIHEQTVQLSVARGLQAQLDDLLKRLKSVEGKTR